MRITYQPVMWSGGALAILLGARLLSPTTSIVSDLLHRDELAKSITHSFAKLQGVPDPARDIITGATEAAKSAEAPSAEGQPAEVKQSADPSADKKDEPATGAAASSETVDVPQINSGERTLLQRLAERRAQIEQREKAIAEREALLAAAEQKLEQRIAELKAADTDLKASVEARKADQVTLKPLVVMYEAMKPKDAARIFEKLQLNDLLPLAQAMNPRKLSDILAQLDPALASKLTIGMAPAPRRSPTADANGSLPELPDLPVPVR